MREPRTRSRPDCPLCGVEGEVLHERLVDRLFGAPGEWSMRRCRYATCGLHWIDPVVVADDLHLLYSRYYTHEPDAEKRDRPRSKESADRGPSLRQQVRAAMLRRRFGYRLHDTSAAAEVVAALLLSVPFFADRLGRSLLWLDRLEGGRLLDVGCGSGALLGFYQQLGWDCVGLEPDPQAADQARRRGLAVHTGLLEEAPWPDQSFDRITMVHVIEHVPDPVATLQNAFALLRPGGLLVFVTPSVDALGAAHFGRAWRGWETPRHLHLGPPELWAGIARRVGFEVVEARSNAIGADWMYAVSASIRRGDHRLGRNPNEAAGRDFRLRSFLFGQWEYWSTKGPFGREVGEECVVTVRRPDEGRQA